MVTWCAMRTVRRIALLFLLVVVLVPVGTALAAVAWRQASGGSHRASGCRGAAGVAASYADQARRGMKQANLPPDPYTYDAGLLGQRTGDYNQSAREEGRREWLTATRMWAHVVTQNPACFDAAARAQAQDALDKIPLQP